MSKKPRQSRHRVPALAMASETVTPEYQAEVNASMEKLERRYAKAKKALAAAEAKAERAREQAERLAAKQEESARVAANQAAEEARLSDYLERIKVAAKHARVAEARRDLDRQHREAVAQRNASTARRKAEAKAIREREQLIARSRNDFSRLESDVIDRRREVREIEHLMMPGNYAGRNHRGTGTAYHNSGRR